MSSFSWTLKQRCGSTIIPINSLSFFSYARDFSTFHHLQCLVVTQKIDLIVIFKINYLRSIIDKKNGNRWLRNLLNINFYSFVNAYGFCMKLSIIVRSISISGVDNRWAEKRRLSLLPRIFYGFVFVGRAEDNQLKSDNCWHAKGKLS